MSMKFCRECNNLLYPRENKEYKSLEYACRMCPYVDRSSEHSSCVFSNELIKDSSTRLEVILSDMNKDAALQRSRTAKCRNPNPCDCSEAVFFLVSTYIYIPVLNTVEPYMELTVILILHLLL